jgi:hypothetical protein
MAAGNVEYPTIQPAMLGLDHRRMDDVGKDWQSKTLGLR